MTNPVNIELEHLFRNALSDGYNLFIGAGFSVLASSKSDKLPTGGQLCERLKSKFKDLKLPQAMELPLLCTIIKSKRLEEFRDYCTRSFTVVNYDDRYNSIIRTNIENIFTTNIDDLMFKVVEASGEKYIHDVFLTGANPNDSRVINYFALHGCVLHQNRDFVFGATEIASAFGAEPQLWHYLSHLLSVKPTLFWGYGLRDSGTLQAINNVIKSQGKSSNRMWIILDPNEIDNEEYFRALEFNIIYADTSSFLEFYQTLSSTPTRLNSASKGIGELFKEYVIPSAGQVPVRESVMFYQGAEPTWYDIFQRRAANTSHVKILENIIASGRNILIKGVPACGKTTLLKLLACTQTDYRSSVLYVSGYMDTAKAEILSRSCSTGHVKVFWDNVFDSADSVAVIQENKNIQLIAADRDYYYEFGFHKLNMDNFFVYDCSDLSQSDQQTVLTKIPENLVSLDKTREIQSRHDSVSVFDIISYCVTDANLTDRVKRIFSDLSREDHIYGELFVLISYFHRSRVPAAFDAVSSYCGLQGFKIEQIYGLLSHLGALVREYSGAFSSSDQDYFAVRSQVFAEAAIDESPRDVLRTVVENVLRNISMVKIPHYDVFQRGAFRNEIFARAFPNWKDGLQIYDDLFEFSPLEKSKPYIKQQCALYLAQKGKYRDAFDCIDQAVTISGGRIFTIRNTQARIKFEANINVFEDDEIYVRDSLFDSMKTLEVCHKSDRRKQSHAEYYAKFAMKLDDRYEDDETYEMLQRAKIWLEEEVKRPGAGRRLVKLLGDVQARVSAVGRATECEH
ncbi:SIR2 family protein [Pleomorphomonas sp. PLEO]|uniref:SIR2 family protein n=1 Tax=Pleomorphomonas sp. PLEO TaxID=3239306 RepID=UPI00351DC694